MDRILGSERTREKLKALMQDRSEAAGGTEAFISKLRGRRAKEADCIRPTC
jgi:hypothetical protein